MNSSQLIPNFESLPSETQFNILLNLDVYDIISVCRTNNSISKICKDWNFWYKKILSIGFNIPYNIYYKPNINPTKRYLQISENFDPSCFTNDADDDQIQECMEQAGKIGDLKLINLFRSKGGILITAIIALIEAGHFDVIDIMIENDHNVIIPVLVASLNPKYLDYFKEILNENIDYLKPRRLNYILINASKCGYLDIVKLLISKGANNIEDAILSANEGRDYTSGYEEFKKYADLISYLQSIH